MHCSAQNSSAGMVGGSPNGSLRMVAPDLRQHPSEVGHAPHLQARFDIVYHFLYAHICVRLVPEVVVCALHQEQLVVAGASAEHRPPQNKMLAAAAAAATALHWIQSLEYMKCEDRVRRTRAIQCKHDTASTVQYTRRCHSTLHQVSIDVH